MTIVLVFVLGALLGWVGCYFIKVLEWKMNTYMSFQTAQAYAMCFFQTNAKKDCGECSGLGFLEGEYIVEPCKTCFAKPTEIVINGITVIINHGKSGEFESTPESNTDISGPGSA